MTNNAELIHRIIRKAFTTGQYVDGNGRLFPKYVNTYFNYLRSVSRPLMSAVTQHKSTQMFERISKRYLGAPITGAAPEAGVMTLGTDYPGNKPQIGGTVKIENKKVRVRLNIPDEVQYVDVSLQRAFAEIMDLVLTRHAVDMELLLVNGNEALVGTDPYTLLYQSNDGLEKLTRDANTVDAGGALLDFDLLAEMWETMPDFLKDAPGMLWVWNPSATMRLSRFLQNMMTVVGNDALRKVIPPPYGIPYLEASAIPRTLPITGQAVDTPPQVISTTTGPFQLSASARYITINIDGRGDVVVDLSGGVENSYFARTVCEKIKTAFATDGNYGAAFKAVAKPTGMGGVMLTSPTAGSGGSVQVKNTASNDAKGVLGFAAATTTGGSGGSLTGVTQDGSFVWLVNPQNFGFSTLGSDIRIDERWEPDVDAVKFTIYAYNDIFVQEMDMVGRISNVRL
jgi:hypothetical protein